MVHYNRNQIPLQSTVKHIHVLKMILETKLIFRLDRTLYTALGKPYYILANSIYYLYDECIKYCRNPSIFYIRTNNIKLKR